MALIVILDDRVTNRNIFSKLAASIEEGVTVRAFGEPVAALEWLERNPADLIITDYKMPQMDGAEFTRRLRMLATGADVPVVVITVYEDRSFRLRALESGATDFLQSPVDHHEFKTRARNLLKLYEQQQIIKSRAQTLERKLEDTQRSHEKLLRDSRERLAQVIDTVPAMISAVDRQGRCVFVNAYQAALAGGVPSAFVGRDVTALLGIQQTGRNRALDRLVFDSGESLPGFEEETTDASGNKRVYLTTKAPLRDGNDNVDSVLTMALDITDRKQAESRLRHMAHHDPLTELPNRALLRERVQRALGRARRGGRGFALHFLDLDRFKAVNDALGHFVGDQLLQAVSRRLIEVAGEGNTVARLGGDEFAILQTNVGERAEAGELAERVLASLTLPFTCEGQHVSSGASIGITLHPGDGNTVEELLRNADVATYRAKADGRNAYTFYVRDMNVRARAAISLESDLRYALLRNEFVVHFQPQVSLRTGRVVGAEALLRWKREGGGLMKPGEFLPLAEETGLIVPINDWVLRESCTRAVQWGRAGMPGLRCAVNLSPMQFRKQDVLRTVMGVLEDTGLDPSLLELELTESILMENADAAARTLRDLRAEGVQFSIDDFGTGYSSLSYVKNFPVGRLKIDQSFIRNLKTDPSDTAIVRAIINLAHSLKMEVVAEGVETPEQFTQLIAEGCDEMQGYYFSPPLQDEDFQALVQHGHVLPQPA